MFDRVLHAIRVRGEFRPQVHRAVVADHRRFRCLRHYGFAEHDSRMLDAGKHRLDVRAGFNHQHDGQRIAAHVEVINVLLRSVVVHPEIILLQIKNHLALRVAHNHRGRHSIHAHANGMFCCSAGEICSGGTPGRDTAEQPALPGTKQSAQRNSPSLLAQPQSRLELNAAITSVSQVSSQIHCSCPVYLIRRRVHALLTEHCRRAQRLSFRAHSPRMEAAQVETKQSCSGN